MSKNSGFITLLTITVSLLMLSLALWGWKQSMYLCDIVEHYKTFISNHYDTQLLFDASIKLAVRDFGHIRNKLSSQREKEIVFDLQYSKAKDTVEGSLMIKRFSKRNNNCLLLQTDLVKKNIPVHTLRCLLTYIKKEDAPEKPYFVVSHYTVGSPL